MTVSIRIKIISLPIFFLILYFSVGFYGFSNEKREGEKYALIVNTWNDFPKENTTNVDAYPVQALQAYYVLKSKGYTDEKIFFCLYHKNDTYVDLNCDGKNDLSKALIDYEDDAITKHMIVTIFEYLREKVAIYDESLVYLIGHGKNVSKYQTTFTFENGDELKQDELVGLINGINCKKIVILLDFCYSGNYLDSFALSEKIIVCSSAFDKLSWNYWDWYKHLNTSDLTIFGDSGSVFFHPFWKRFNETSSFEEAYNYGTEQCIRWGYIDPKSTETTKVQDPKYLATTRTLVDKFIDFYPGGSLAFGTIFLIFPIFFISILLALIVPDD